MPDRVYLVTDENGIPVMMAFFTRQEDATTFAIQYADSFQKRCKRPLSWFIQPMDHAEPVTIFKRV